MASRISKHHVIRDHDNGTVHEHIEIESGENVKPDETTARAEAMLKDHAAKQVQDVSSTIFGSMDGIFAAMDSMFSQMDKAFGGDYSHTSVKGRKRK